MHKHRENIGANQPQFDFGAEVPAFQNIEGGTSVVYISSDVKFGVTVGSLKEVSSDPPLLVAITTHSPIVFYLPKRSPLAVLFLDG